MELLRIEAVYQKGALKLPHELPLNEGQRITITIHPPRPFSAAERMYGLIPWTGDPEELHRFLENPDEGHLGER